MSEKMDKLSTEAATELRQKLSTYQRRKTELQSVRARLEERVSQAEATRERALAELLRIAGVSTVEEARAKYDSVYMRVEIAMREIDAKLSEAGFDG